MLLSADVSARTSESDAKLRSNVSSTWGSPQEQSQPTASLDRVTVIDGNQSLSTATLPAQSSRVDVNLSLEHRKKGLLWYSTYAVRYFGEYTFENPDPAPRSITFRLLFPAKQAIYDGLNVKVNGEPAALTASKDGVFTSVQAQPGETVTFAAAYRSFGLSSWRYKLGEDITQTRNFQLTMHTNFDAIDFPADTLSPKQKHRKEGGWDLVWNYSDLISGFAIGMIMPEKVQPGPLAGDVCRFAPVSLLLFFFVMFILTTLRKIDLHPMNYFFLAAAFFAFHLLLSYLVDRIDIGFAFAICSLVSVGLVVSYLRLVVGPRFAILEAGGAQLLYLVLFSYTFFIQGLTGLAITIGCILTLFVSMQVTARVRWTELFGQAAKHLATVRQ